MATLCILTMAKPTFLLDSGTGNRTQHKHAEARPTTRWPRSFVKTKREAHGYCLLGIIGLGYSNFVKTFLTHKALKPRNMSKVDSSPPPPGLGRCWFLPHRRGGDHRPWTGQGKVPFPTTGCRNEHTHTPWCGEWWCFGNWRNTRLSGRLTVVLMLSRVCAFLGGQDISLFRGQDEEHDDK